MKKTVLLIVMLIGVPVFAQMPPLPGTVVNLASGYTEWRSMNGTIGMSMTHTPDGPQSITVFTEMPENFRVCIAIRTVDTTGAFKSDTVCKTVGELRQIYPQTNSLTPRK